MNLCSLRGVKHFQVQLCSSSRHFALCLSSLVYGDLYGGLYGGLIVLGCLPDEWADRPDPSLSDILLTFLDLWY